MSKKRPYIFDFHNNLCTDKYYLDQLKITKYYIYIGKKYNKDYIISYIGGLADNLEIISENKINKISDSIILSFGLFDNIIGENNKLFLIDIFGEYNRNKFNFTNYIYLFSNNNSKFYDSINFFTYINSNIIGNNILDYILYKTLVNFYFYRNKNLTSVKSGYLTRIDLPVGTYCDKDCIFCNEGGLVANNLGMGNSLEDNKLLLENEKIDWVTLGHREPTFSPFFIDNLKICKKNNISTISVISAGYGFDDYNFCIKALENGLNEIRLSIHGHNSKVHDLITQKHGSFNIIKKGLYNLSLLSGKYDFDIFVMIVICEQNKNNLLDIFIFLKEIGISRIAFSFVEIRGSALNKVLKIVPDMDNIVFELEKIFNYYESININTNESLNIENIPYCKLNKKFHKYVGFRTIKKGGKKNNIKVINQYRGKEYLDECNNCEYIGICEGIHEGYIDIYGKEGFIPFKKVKKVVNFSYVLYSKDNKFKNYVIDISNITDLLKVKKIIIILIQKGYRKFSLKPYLFNNKTLLLLMYKYNIEYFNLYID